MYVVFVNSKTYEMFSDTPITKSDKFFETLFKTELGIFLFK